MKNIKTIFWLFALLLISLSSFGQFTSSSYCSPTESWLPLPGDPFAPTDGSGEEFTTMNGVLYMMYFDFVGQSRKIASWDGSSWTEEASIPIGGFVPYGFTSYKNQLYVGGGFSESTTGVPGGNGIIRWDGSQWFGLDSGVVDTAFGNTRVRNMHVFQGELYVGGAFDKAGSVFSQGIAKWDGTSWSAVGGGVDGGIFNPNAMDFVEYQGKLVVGGSFETAGSLTVNNIATWDGSVWEALGQGADREITSVGVYQGDLIAYGFYIKSFDADTIHQMARWDGADWNYMGMVRNEFAEIRDFEVFEGDLYAAGAYMTMFPDPSIKIMRYDSTSWHPVASPNSVVRELTVYQDRLYAIGAFEETCGVPTHQVARLCSQGNCGLVSGKVFKDDDGDCEIDAGELALVGRSVKIDPLDIWIPTDTSGRYNIFLDTGNYSISIPDQQYYQRLCDTLIQVSIGQGSSNDSVDFALDPILGIEDLRITMTIGFPRPGFVVPVFLTYKNIGTEIMSGTVVLVHDSLLTFDSTNTATLSYLNNTLEWSYSNLQVDESRNIVAWFTLPPDPLLLGDSVLLASAIYPILGDEDTTNNRDVFEPIITGAYDPNDKAANPPAGDIPLTTSSFTYTIRFQNTGTDTAFNVILKDTLTDNVSIETLELLSASHPYYFEIEDGRTAKWVFEDILLPDSNVNEAASNGFVKYKIQAVPGLDIGDSITNRAAIYFDFNPPIITNTVSHTYTEWTTAIPPVISIPLEVYPNPAKDRFILRGQEAWQDAELRIMDAKGRVVLQLSHLQGNEVKVNRGDWVSGVYIYQFKTADGKQAIGKIVFE